MTRRFHSGYRRLAAQWSGLPLILRVVIYLAGVFVPVLFMQGIRTLTDQWYPKGFTGEELASLVKNPNQRQSEYRKLKLSYEAQDPWLEAWWWGKRNQPTAYTELYRWGRDPQAWRLQLKNYTRSRLRPLLESRRLLVEVKGETFPQKVYELTTGPLSGSYIGILSEDIDDWNPPSSVFLKTKKYLREEFEYYAPLLYNQHPKTKEGVLRNREEDLLRNPGYGVLMEREYFCKLENVTCY